MHREKPIVTDADILVVDDAQENLRLLAAILREKGYRAHPTQDGELAIKYARSNQPDLILLDIKMPDIDGYEVCRRLKDDDLTRDIPVIFISGLGSVEDKVKAFKAGGVDYITKPFQQAEVLARVHNHVTICHLQKEARETNLRLEDKIRGRTKKLTDANKMLQTEIDERQRSDNALIESKIRYRSIFEDSPISLREEDFSEVKKYLLSFLKDNTDYSAFFRDNPDVVSHCAGLAKIIDVNQSTLELFKAENKEELQSELQKIFTVESLSVFAQELASFSMGEKHFESEVPQKTLKGDTIWTFMSVSIAPGFEDCWGRVFVSVIDTSDRKKAVEEKIRLEKQLIQAQKMEAIGALSGGIAHDFNNILAVVFGYTQLALNNAEKDSQMWEYLQQIFSAGIRAKDLIRQILTFSRQSEQKMIPVEVRSILKETIKFLRASLPTTIEISKKINGDSMIMGDPTQIHQVLMNLGANAGHAMNENGGILKVELSDVNIDDDFVSRYPELKPGPHLQLVVSDNGCGMPQEVLDRIFDPFFTTKEKGVGTGLGLSVVHGIVKNHMGTIVVYSELGKGASFTIFLPVIEREAIPSLDSESLMPTGTERILFVDDEPALADMSKRLLESLGYNVVSCTDSLKALEMFQEDPSQFDLVITDMTMPHLTGEELSREILQLNPEIPIILCTGFSSTVNEEKTAAMGIKAFVLKPILKRDMAETIRTVLHDRK